MTPPAGIIGLVASIIAIFEAGYLLGKWRANTQRRNTLDEAIAVRVRQLLGAIEIRQLTTDTQAVSPGQTLRIFFDIFSKATFPYQVWLGASILPSGGGEHFDESEDKEITLEPGSSIQSRYLTVPKDISVGNHRVVGAIWLGQRATPANSIQLARLDLSGTLRVG